ncbi:plant UBX domain-containing protein 8-like [Olea europaea var. sylvestris]|uniref:plant UBX domain-containing protein 8-like n=1 Tax=Olea europaea var. sylvestris TaxID=158386 RepID=UPI000C1D0174|nr:plant UBX domain-containing protein 8-like [Olea europaea var. sylvestris]
MARANQGEIETFMSITGVSDATAVQKLEEHHGNLNEAVNAHFSAGDRNITNQASSVDPHDDVMDIDDPIQDESHRPPFSLPVSTKDANTFSLLGPNFTGSIVDRGTDFTSGSHFVSHPREVRRIPIEMKDGNGPMGDSGNAPTNEDVTVSARDHGGTVIIDDDDEANVPNGPISAPTIVDEADYNKDIEEEMVRAAIEASKQDAAKSEQQLDNYSDLRDPMPQPRQSHPEDAEFDHAVSSSLKTAEQEKALQEGKIGALDLEAEKSAETEEPGKLKSSSGRQSRLEIGSSSIQNEADVEEQPLVRQRNRHMTSDSLEGVEVTPPPSQHDNLHQSQQNESVFPSDEWGGISSVEHDEAVMLEAAMFGGIPEGSGYDFRYPPHELIQDDLDRSMGLHQRHIPRPPWGGISSVEHDEAVMLEAAMFGGIPEGSGYDFRYPPHELIQDDLDRSMGLHQRHIPRPPSPSLTAQRLIREQQDDEFLAALQADREKELKAKEDAEAAIAEERHKEEEMQRRLEEERELERQLAAKEASLPLEPTPDDDNAITLLVRMPDGSRMGRSFLKLDKLQYLFDFIDVGRVVKPGTYRLVNISCHPLLICASSSPFRLILKIHF